ncbi:unnamed protein product [Caenorhabditis angaria]|uniref:Uncharacterized protein n=1 Tax=Caenorhabditis angaria TaxID=860376 RepID=A0A9P1MSM1_9PELO|nr:unnamed protein product [Caenorhabditis angaria]
MPQFFECSFCQRLYSQHSLIIHQKNCLEQKKSEENVVKKPKRSKSSKRKREDVILPERPRTRSLSRSSIDTGQFRICYVCGTQFDVDSIEQHTIKCFQEWSDMAIPLSERFFINEPKQLNIPSIDGTINTFYENQRSVKSSRNCQIVRCRKCNARIAIHLAQSHQCTQYEPTIEFYF